MKRLAVLAAAVALAGCTPKMEITQPNVTAGILQGVDRARITSYRPTEVRTYIRQDGQPIEVAGLQCALRSDELTADFITPALVEMPRFVQSGRFANRGRPAQVLVSCDGSALRGAETFFALDKQVGTATNAGVGGAILTTVVSAAVASSTPWQFPPEVRVTMRPE